MLLMLEGDRGLVGFGSGKLCFPDRSMVGVKPCLMGDYKITKEFDNYAFVVGQALPTEDLSAQELQGLDLEYPLKEVKLATGNCIIQYCLQLGCYQVWYKLNGVVENFYIKEQNSFNTLFNMLKTVKFDYVDYLNSKFKLDTEDKLEEAILSLMSYSHNYIEDILKSLELFDDTILYFVEEYKFSKRTEESAFFFDGSSVVRIQDCEMKGMRKNAKKVRKFKCVELLDILVKYGIAVSNIPKSLQFSDKIARMNIPVSKNNRVLYVFKLNNFSMSYYRSEESVLDRKLVEESKRLYMDYLKSVTKGISSNSVVEIMRKYNIRAVLSSGGGLYD